MNIQTILGSPNKSKPAMIISGENDRIDAWLQHKIEQGKREPFAEVVTLTPSLANRLLSKNGSNRPVSKVNLERLTSDIDGGRWKFNGESIVVSHDGYLNDGQHRCMAVQETGKAVRLVISFGADRESRFTVDTGNARTVGNFLGMQGQGDANSVATVAQYVWLYRERNSLIASGGALSVVRRRPTKAEIFSVATSFPDIEASLKLTKIGAPGGRTLNAFCRWAIARKGGEAEAAVFFESLYSGAGLRAGSPILYARERLTNADKKVSVHARAMLIFRAWNIYRRGGSVSPFERGGRTVTGSFTAKGQEFPPLEA